MNEICLCVVLLLNYGPLKQKQAVRSEHSRCKSTYRSHLVHEPTIVEPTSEDSRPWRYRLQRRGWCLFRLFSGFRRMTSLGTRCFRMHCFALLYGCFLRLNRCFSTFPFEYLFLHVSDRCHLLSQCLKTIWSLRFPCSCTSWLRTIFSSL